MILKKEKEERKNIEEILAHPFLAPSQLWTIIDFFNFFFFIMPLETYYHIFSNAPSGAVILPPICFWNFYDS